MLTIFKKVHNIEEDAKVPQAGRPKRSFNQRPFSGRGGAWTETEVKALFDGIRRHGVGSWTAILSDETCYATLYRRTSCDLKDKWRSCCRNAKAREANGEVLPAIFTKYLHTKPGSTGQASRGRKGQRRSQQQRRQAQQTGLAAPATSNLPPAGSNLFLVNDLTQYGHAASAGSGDFLDVHQTSSVAMSGAVCPAQSDASLRASPYSQEQHIGGAWTVAEVQALAAGVHVHGEGAWNDIMDDARFAPMLYNRTNSDLKDQWRVAKHQWTSRRVNTKGSCERLSSVMSRETMSTGFDNKSIGEVAAEVCVENSSLLHEIEDGTLLDVSLPLGNESASSSLVARFQAGIGGDSVNISRAGSLGDSQISNPPAGLKETVGKPDTWAYDLLDVDLQHCFYSGAESNLIKT